MQTLTDFRFLKIGRRSRRERVGARRRSRAVPGQILVQLKDGDPISGVIGIAGAAGEPFRGWLELTAQLERLRERLVAIPDATAENIDDDH
jgi:hypothetical protein